MGDEEITAYERDPCPTCGERTNICWLEGIRTSDTWHCRVCGWTWVIAVALPEERATELRERAEING